MARRLHSARIRAIKKGGGAAGSGRATRAWRCRGARRGAQASCLRGARLAAGARELFGEEQGARRLFAERFEARGFVDRGADDGEVEPLAAADVAAQDFAEMSSRPRSL